MLRYSAHNRRLSRRDRRVDVGGHRGPHPISRYRSGSSPDFGAGESGSRANRCHQDVHEIGTQNWEGHCISEFYAHHRVTASGGERVEWLELGRTAFVGLAIAVTWPRLWQPLPHFDIAGFAAAFVGGYPIFREAVNSIGSRDEQSTDWYGLADTSGWK